MKRMVLVLGVFLSLTGARAFADVRHLCRGDITASAYRTMDAIFAAVGASHCEDAHSKLLRTRHLDLSREALRSVLPAQLGYETGAFSDLSPLRDLAGYGIRSISLVGQTGITDVAPALALSRLEGIEIRGACGALMTPSGETSLDYGYIP